MENELRRFLEELILSPSGANFDKLVLRIQSTIGNKIINSLDDQKGQELYQLGIDVLGAEEVFFSWLWTNLRPLNHAKPVDKVREGKIDEVIDILNRIQNTSYS